MIFLSFLEFQKLHWHVETDPVLITCGTTRAYKIILSSSIGYHWTFELNLNKLKQEIMSITDLHDKICYVTMTHLRIETAHLAQVLLSIDTLLPSKVISGYCLHCEIRHPS